VHPESRARMAGVCIDCRDADELATFYADLLGWDVVATDGGNWRQLRSPGGELTLNIQGESWYEPPVWPERPGVQHKMMHFEIEVIDLDAAVSRAIAGGAREAVDQPADRDRSRLRIMLDPGGHPFCLFVAGE
jgi:catechol 2,3-dioxygenase-like lactoylglutathione lyase family enzyme